MSVGRKPKPTAIKERIGNPGKRALNKSEPKLDSKLPACPSYLTGEARKEWYRVGKLLVTMRVLTDADRSALAMYCQVYGRWVEAEAQVGKLGVVTRSANGYPMQNPYLNVANACIKQMQSLLAEFGMTPASRSRVQAAGSSDESLADALFAQALSVHPEIAMLSKM